MTNQGNELVYIETSVVSYLTARPTSNLLSAAWQKATADWWDTRRFRFDVCTSQLTMDEAGRGDPRAAARRLRALRGIAILPITGAALELASALIRDGALPRTADADALHIGIATLNNADFLLTWNFRHLANAQTRNIIRNVCAQMGYTCPEICTPIELTGGLSDE